ncbi:hypothetical protein LA345_39815 (plasmid) [Burkholderia vietnamiensis]|uniref:Uncharacterized protein n=1 Tax=Burkholderia vietnamiensis (strain G4 / LMG 22486) TaxID=269482 RepID=A4JUE5_BURVG|nr:conserved hypothetical protein [Burkholderia vietnamiensis G4]MCB4349939.1 hypothetical protein [Burkholderia vietnamiensis]
MQDTRFILFSPSEATNTGAGFWSSEDGWSQFDSASEFDEVVRHRIPFPKSARRDAGWVLVGSILHMALARDFSKLDAASKFDQLADRYADKVIAGRSHLFDALEIQGVREDHQPGNPWGSCIEVNNEDPQVYSVYAHQIHNGEFGGVECIGDFAQHAAAVTFAAELRAAYGWPVHDYVPENSRTPRKECWLAGGGFGCPAPFTHAALAARI